MDATKKPALMTVARVLAEQRTPYAIIEGLALQTHHPDPRTTLDIDVAVLTRNQIPRTELERQGLRHHQTFDRSENWRAGDRTPIRFTDSPELRPAIESATEIRLEGVAIRVMSAVELLRAKIRAASDDARRKSKRLQDSSDIQALLENDASLLQSLSESERRSLETLTPEL